MSILWDKPESETESTHSLSSDSDRNGSLSGESDVSPDEEGGGGGADGLIEDSRTISSIATDPTPESPTPIISKQEMIRRYYLRQHVEKLKAVVNSQEKKVQKVRQQLVYSQEQRAELRGELESLNIKIGNNDGNMGMLKGMKNKMELQIEAEGEVERTIVASLLKEEGELLQAKMALSKFRDVEEDIRKGEKAWKHLKNKQLSHRLQMERKLLTNMGISESVKERQLLKLKEQRESAKATMTEAREASKEKTQFIQDKLIEHKAEKAKSEEEHRQHLEQRMKSILNLKKNISSSEDTIQALQLLKHEKERKEQIKKDNEWKEILEDGGNPEEVFLRRKRLQQFHDKLDEFKKRQRERKLDIVVKLLEEEKSLRREMKRISPEKMHKIPYPIKLDSLIHKIKKKKKRRRKKKSDELTVSEEGEMKIDEATPESESSNEEETAEEEKKKPLVHVPQSSKSIKSIMEPEIRGLWEKDPAIKDTLPSCREVILDKEGKCKVEKRGPSKAEQQIMKRTLTNLRKSITVKQVAAGREFKGKAFNSKPEEIIFRDFDVGKVHRMKVKLTNISYSVNYCRLEGVSPKLMDFITVHFDPPGSMSAGMTCHMQVIFKPQIEEDIEGDILMTSQTGPFSIPIKCLAKKCLVSADCNQVDFGQVCVGETVRKEVTLWNKGALATDYEITLSQPTVSLPKEMKQKVVTLSYGGVFGEKLADESRARLSEKSSIMSAVERPSSADKFGLGILAGGGTIKSKSISLIPMPQKQSSEHLHTHTNAQAEQDTIQVPQQDKLSQVSQQDKLSQVSQQDKLSQVSQQDKLSQDASSKSQVKNQDAEDTDEGGTHVEDTTTISETAETDGDTGTKTQTQPYTDQEQEPEEIDTNIFIKVEGSSYGSIRAFSSCSIKLVYCPESVGEHSAYFAIDFSHPSVPSMEISVCGSGTDLPVYTKQEEMEFGICMVGQLYQKSLILHNRLSLPFEVSFEVPSDLQEHLEVLPKHGMIQGEASFTAQLKFRPHSSLLQESTKAKYYRESDDYWRFPISSHIGTQNRPVSLTLLAQVTLSELVLAPLTLNFGNCTTEESVICTLTLTNPTLLPQTFGFIGLPDFIDVQPNDGFGQILPEESIQLDVIFTPNKPGNYSFVLTCKSGINKTYKIECNGCGVLSPLKMCGNLINFAPTPIGSTSTATISLSNPKLTRLNSAVARGTAPSQGPRAFQFTPPEGCPISFSPLVGVLEPGQSIEVQVQCCPKISEEDIEKIAGSMNKAESTTSQKVKTRKLSSPKPQQGQGNRSELLPQAGSPRSELVPPGAPRGNNKSRSDLGAASKTSISRRSELVPPAVSPTRSNSKNSMANRSTNTLTSNRSGMIPRTSPSPHSSIKTGLMSPASSPPSSSKSSMDDLASHSTTSNLLDMEHGRAKALLEAYHTALCSYSNQCLELKIPCFVSDILSASSQPADPLSFPSFRSEHTLYLEVVAPLVRPSLILTGSQSPTIDFGSVGVGNVSTKTVTVKNISGKDVELRSSVLNPSGPFQLRNSLRTLSPSASHKLLLQFSPEQGPGAKMYDSLLLYCGNESSPNLELQLVGAGVHPEVDISLGSGEDLYLNMGHAMAKDTVSQPFTLTNNSPLPVKFKLAIESLELNANPAEKFRACNYNAQPPFVCVPSEGVLEAKEAKGIKVSFMPDRQSQSYHDNILVRFNEKHICNIHLTGKAWTNNMHVHLISIADAKLPPPIDDAVTMIPTLSEENATHSAPPLLITFIHHPEVGGGPAGEGGVEQQQPASRDKRELVISCIKSNLVKKPSGDFTIDPIHSSNRYSKCFAFESMKGNVEAGGSKTVAITFTPPKDASSSTIEANTNLTLKGDIIQVHPLLLRAMITE